MDNFIHKVLSTNPAFSKAIVNATGRTRVVGTVPNTIKDSSSYHNKVNHTCVAMR